VSGLYTSVEVALLLILAMAGVILGEFIHGPGEDDEAAGEARGSSR
jgi:hypothetical protein